MEIFQRDPGFSFLLLFLGEHVIIKLYPKRIKLNLLFKLSYLNSNFAPITSFEPGHIRETTRQQHGKITFNDISSRQYVPKHHSIMHFIIYFTLCVRIVHGL